MLFLKQEISVNIGNKLLVHLNFEALYLCQGLFIPGINDLVICLSRPMEMFAILTYTV